MTATATRPVYTVAKRKSAGPHAEPPEPPEGRRQQTTLRAYADTAKKLNQLAILRDVSVHDLIDELFTELLDNELIVATENRLADLKKRQQGR